MADNARVEMVPGVIDIDGIPWRYAVSDNVGADTWAINVHGFFAGGGVYWRESARLAAATGWRVANPSLPGFAGTPPFPFEEVRLSRFAEGIAAFMDALGIEQAVLLGHSMGGAIVVQTAHDYSDRVLGIVYRNGVATSSWQERKGLLVSLLRPLGEMPATTIDMLLGLTMDLPQMALVRGTSVLATGGHDIAQNARHARDWLPVAAMLASCDFTDMTQRVADKGEVPLLPVWGRFDHGVPSRTAREIGEMFDAEVQWVLGAHSWMIPQPGAQARVLRRTAGRSFVRRVAERAAA